MNNQMFRRAVALALAFTLVLTVAQPGYAWFFGFGSNEPESNESVLGDVAVSSQLPWVTAAPMTEVDDSDGLAPNIADEPEQTNSPEQAAPPETEFGTRPTDESNLIRVKLSSLGKLVAMGLSFDGQYAVDGDKGFRLASGTEASVAVDGEKLLLTVGGLTIDMGISINFTRHKSGGGVHIHENKYDTSYVGDLLLTNEKGVIVPVVTLDIDDYLYGVVPYEMSDSFPIEALKAQSVAARTYALSRRAANSAREYDVVDTTADQVFRGYYEKYENAIAAVDATRYVAGLYKDKYATTYFSASNGGQTAMPGQIWSYSGDYGYLDVRDDPYDLKNKNSVVKKLTVDSDFDKLDGGLKRRLNQALEGLFEGSVSHIYVRDIEPVSSKSEGTRMFTKLEFTLELEFAKDNEFGEEIDVPEDNIRKVQLEFYKDLKPNFGLKINSADCETVSVKKLTEEGAERPTSFVIEARRFGHGVGLSQRGAQYMATAEGMSWQQILGFYYPGLELYKMGFQVAGVIEIEALPASIGYARAKPTPKPTPAPLRALNVGEYYAIIKLASKGSTLNVRAEADKDAQVVSILNHAQRVIVKGATEDGWAQIETTETRGYCSMDYVVAE